MDNRSAQVTDPALSADGLAALHAQVEQAAKYADWQQVVLNGGPPCFHIERDGRFCFRAERWNGHHFTDEPFHNYVSLDDFLRHLETVRASTRVLDRVEQALSDEVLLKALVRRENVSGDGFAELRQELIHAVAPILAELEAQAKRTGAKHE